jgi:plasmid stabilization system protein ParE
MPGYRLSQTALREVGSILGELHANASPSAADATERQLFSAFQLLGRFPRIGHPRPDLTAKRLLFHNSKPYLIAFRREADLVSIVHVVHGARDLTRLL